MDNNFGLSEVVINLIHSVFKQHTSIQKAVIYGSRAKGNYREGADIALALFGKNITVKELRYIYEELNKLLLPYTFDISIYDDLENDKQKEHINRAGKDIFIRNSSKTHSWEVKKLSDICESLFAGGDVPKNNFSKVKTSEYNIPIYSNGISEKGLYGYTNIKKVVKPSITISARGTIGYSAIREEPFFPIIRLIVLTPKSEMVNLAFMKFAIECLEFSNSGSSIPQLTIPMIAEYKILLPPLPEQQRIVEILDKAFAEIDKAKANAEKNLKNAKELFDSYLNNIFENKGKGWVEKRLGEIAFLKGGKRVPKGYKLLVEKTNYPYLRVTDFNDNGTINLKDIQYISEKIFNQIKNYTISSNDLYISIAGTIGKTGIIPIELEGANLTENACKLVFKDDIDNKLIYYFTKSSNFLLQTGINTRTTAMPKLALSRLSTIRMSLPNALSMQHKIVQRLDKLSANIQKIEGINRKEIEKLEELKKSILEKAFKGELNSQIAGIM